MQTRSMLAVCFLACAALLLPAAASAQAERPAAVTEQDLAAPPDATIEFDAQQVRLIIGGATGKGVLRYKGKSYPFTATGVTLGGAGATSSSGTGTVHFLKSPADFAGTYSGIGVGATLVQGAAATSFQNAKGVVLSVKSKTEGAALSMGVSSLTIKMQ